MGTNTDHPAPDSVRPTPGAPPPFPNPPAASATSRRWCAGVGHEPWLARPARTHGCACHHMCAGSMTYTMRVVWRHIVSACGSPLVLAHGVQGSPIGVCGECHTQGRGGRCTHTRVTRRVCLVCVSVARGGGRRRPRSQTHLVSPPHTHTHQCNPCVSTSLGFELTRGTPPARGSPSNHLWAYP